MNEILSSVRKGKFLLVFFLLIFVHGVEGQGTSPNGNPIRKLVGELDSPETGPNGYLSINNGDRDKAALQVPNQRSGNSTDYIYFSNGQGPIFIKRGDSLFFGNPKYKSEFENNWTDNVRPTIPGIVNDGVAKDPVQLPSEKIPTDGGLSEEVLPEENDGEIPDDVPVDETPENQTPRESDGEPDEMQ